MKKIIVFINFYNFFTQVYENLDLIFFSLTSSIGFKCTSPLLSKCKKFILIYNAKYLKLCTNVKEILATYFCGKYVTDNKITFSFTVDDFIIFMSFK